MHGLPGFRGRAFVLSAMILSVWPAWSLAADGPNFRKLTFQENCALSFEALAGDANPRVDQLPDRLDELAERLNRSEKVTQADLLSLIGDFAYERLDEPVQIHLRGLQLLARLSDSKAIHPDGEALAIEVISMYLITGSRSYCDELGAKVSVRLKAAGKNDEEAAFQRHLKTWLEAWNVNVDNRSNVGANRELSPDAAKLVALQKRAIERDVYRYAKAHRLTKPNRPCHEIIDNESEHDRLRRIATCFLREEIKQQQLEMLGRLPTKAEADDAYRALMSELIGRDLPSPTHRE